MNYLKRIDYGDLKFIVNSSGLETDFSELKDSVAFLDSIKNREISMEEVRHKQEEFNTYLTKIRVLNKSEKQKKTLANINKLFDRRDDAIKFVDDYGSMIFEVKREVAEEEPETKPKAKTKRKKISIRIASIVYN